jgi:hypothetical protein
MPNAAEAVVTDDKLKSYLMSVEHPSGREKAAFFTTLGFGETTLEDLKQALLTIGRSGKLLAAIDTRFGSKYVVDGYMTGPAQRSAGVRTVWIMESGEDRPRLVTAYPAPRG